MSQTQKSLTVNIDDKGFKIKIDNKDEIRFLETLKKINDKIKEFKTAYPGLYLQEYLSMAILWISHEQISQEDQKQKELEQEFSKKINQWADLLQNLK